MKITFLDPGFGKKSFGTWGNSHWSSIINHALCSLAASAKEHGFHDVSLIDIRRLKNWDQFDEEIEKHNPDVMAFTMMSCDLDMVGEAVSRTKRLLPNIVTIVGGTHATYSPEVVIKNENFDYILLKEGEIHFSE